MPEFADNARKSAVRAAVLARRRSMPPATRDDADAAIVREVLSAVRRTGARRVAAYVPVGSEPGGPALVPALAAAVDRLVLPVLRDDLDLDWAVYDGVLEAAGRGLSEPAGPRLGVTAVAAVDLVLVPALAVDASGTRLGRGGGSYDRALARVEAAPVVALLYADELRMVGDLPALSHDRRVTGAITPTRGLVWLTRLDESGPMTHH